MSFFKRNRGSAPADAPDGAAPAPGDPALTDRYAKLNERQAVAELARLNQAELTAIDQFERAHRDREGVLNKLRYLREQEPLPGYDTLEAGAVAEALAGADTDTVKAVREYERKHQNRPTVIAEIARSIHLSRDRADASADAVPGTAQPLVVGNGLPIKVEPERGIGTP